tara:strand:- start:48 stop:323 length:276 start_codon:yes stop_codon:yes gene_type:complete
MDKNQYKELVAEYMRRNAKLEQENLKLRVALCNLRDNFLDMGGDPNQLELFDKDDVSQLKIFESPDGGKTVYERNAGDYDNKTKVIKLHDK